MRSRYFAPLPLARAGAVAGLVLCVAVSAARAQSANPDLSVLSLEQLMNIEVTSVSKRAQPLSETAAAVYVLTGEDIRRSGAQTIPDMLRLVPGLHVGQIDTNYWSVSIRGFGGRLANKLLVMVDGQSAYSQLFSGVFWNSVQVPPAAIDRIEIVRGPGGTLWGANAVTGVVNIITRSASRGAQVSGGFGSADAPGFMTAQYGAAFGQHGAFRVDASGFGFAGGASIPGTHIGSDTWTGGRVGLRIDTPAGDRNSLTVIASLTGSHATDALVQPTVASPFSQTFSGDGRRGVYSALGRWSRRGATGATTTVQSSVEHVQMDLLVGTERRNTFDVEVQQARTLASRHQLVFGGNYRLSSDDLTGAAGVLRFTPSRRALHFFSGFAQDEIGMFAERLRLTVGAKLEHNDYTGWEAQPNVRGLFTVSPRQSVWAAVSRAVRLPNRGESDGEFAMGVQPPQVPGGLPQLIVLYRDPAQPNAAEILVAYEAGYRAQPTSAVSFALSTFLNRFHGLGTNHIGTPTLAMTPAPHLVVPVLSSNTDTARYAGAELTVEWQPAPRLRFGGGYSYMHPYESATPDPTVLGQAPDYPNHQTHMRVALTLPRQIELDTMLRHVGRLEVTGVPSYVGLDVRAGVRLFRHLDLSIVGRNLLQDEHVEYLPDVLFFSSVNVRRSVGVRFGLQF